VSLKAIRTARDRIADLAFRTPLVRLNVDDAPVEIYLKLENFQRVGSFKVRGAGNAMRAAQTKVLADGVYTASAGNMAQGLAYVARRMGVPCTVVVPDHAPQIKLDAIRRYGAGIVKVPFDEWWQIIVTNRFEGMSGRMIHPVSDPAVVAGNGTIGLEIIEDLPQVDAVVVPFGGGGLSSGIAAAIRALKPKTTIYAAEVETAAPLAASFAANEPREIEYTPSFVDGIGGKSVLPEMWPMVRALLDDSIVVSLAQTAEAIRLMAMRNRVIAEGAAGASVAAALSGQAGEGTVVCIISGGNIDAAILTKILSGQVP
ncbi:MAG: pyridoxal-phosphate dependent enzyme, partial [Phycisphaerales bacterium]